MPTLINEPGYEGVTIHSDVGKSKDHTGLLWMTVQGNPVVQNPNKVMFLKPTISEDEKDFRGNPKIKSLDVTIPPKPKHYKYKQLWWKFCYKTLYFLTKWHKKLGPWYIDKVVKRCREDYWYFFALFIKVKVKQ